MEQAGAATYRR